MPGWWSPRRSPGGDPPPEEGPVRAILGGRRRPIREPEMLSDESLRRRTHTSDPERGVGSCQSEMWPVVPEAHAQPAKGGTMRRSTAFLAIALVLAVAAPLPAAEAAPRGVEAALAGLPLRDRPQSGIAPRCGYHSTMAARGAGSAWR